MTEAVGSEHMCGGITTVKSFRLAGVCFVILTASVCGRAQRDNSISGQVKVNVKGNGERFTSIYDASGFKEKAALE